ncbi:MAG: tRNA epoxyqueuosine(34) reductase QueG [Bradymonadales bacterium]|nr:MAG: tRNA epoxyqueuosine(34) reductase QueG [Bradymonadales bacterium]
MSFDLDSFSKDLGWTISGVSDLHVPIELKDQYQEWLRKYKGPQMQYLERRMEERLDPLRYFPKAKAILCFGLYYFPGWAEGPVKVSNYSWGEDYHRVLKEKLQKTERALRDQFPELESKLCVDTAPVLEKFWAQRAGLGWQGKNTLLLHPRHGSSLFLGEILINLSPETFKRKPVMTDHCGSCRRCLDACPTDALQAYVLDAKKCISYWTLEHRTEFSDDTPNFHNWIAGCDICQEVCPWNRKLIPLEDSEALSFQKLQGSDIEDPNWPQRIESKAISYVPKENWKRNLDWIQRAKDGKDTSQRKS